MPKTIIEQFPKETRQAAEDGTAILKVAEFFCDTIQGENLSGIPSSFLRLQGCTLDCVWCDTLEVWRVGNPYSVNELLQMIEDNGMVERFRNGQHLILTGGSPLKQEKGLIALVKGFVNKFGFKPIIEIENETVRVPSPELIDIVDYWNNSPKLENSGMKERVRYKPEAIKAVASLPNSYFKFVVVKEEEWKEIEKYFIEPGLIKKSQIVLMPEGQTREELQKHYEATVNIAVKENVRMCDRLHVTIWNKQTGV